MPLKLIVSNPRAGMIMSNFFAAMVINTVMFNVPLFFQAVLLESATKSGLRLIVSSLASSVVGTATGFLITWTRQLKIWLVAGTFFMIVGTTSMTFLRRDLPEWVYVLVLIPAAMGQGFVLPATFMSVLAVSEQGEQAVVTSTLILWRSLGMVMGVASSSLVLQNALYIYLEAKVSGPEKAAVSLISEIKSNGNSLILPQVIKEVRASVHAIVGLAQPYQEQVIESYALALRATFMLGAVVAMMGFLVILPVRLPKLGHRK